MVEGWNIGKMGLVVLQYRVNDKTRPDLNARIAKILQKPTIPSLHYSIIAGFKHFSTQVYALTGRYFS
jgi:hypothetical protein